MMINERVSLEGLSARTANTQKEIIRNIIIRVRTKDYRTV